MARIHLTTMTPGKAEILRAYVATAPWATDLAPPDRGAAARPLEVLGAYRFDDPDGEVGLETHLVSWGETVLQVPTTYRGAPLPGAEAALIATPEHGVLGRRWVYDGLADPVYVALLVAGTLHGGLGQALTLGRREARMVVRRASVVLGGRAWPDTDRDDLAAGAAGWVPVDDFGPAETHAGGEAVLRSPEWEVRFARRPSGTGPSPDGTAPPGDPSTPLSREAVLTGRLPGRDPLVLARIHRRTRLGEGI